MKHTILTLVAALAVCVGASAQTNTVATTNKVASSVTSTNVSSLSTNDSAGKEYGGFELTLGGGGIETEDESSVGFDISLSTNPFKQLPNLWIGAAQSIYWEPKMAGSTDLYADWNTHVLGDLYINTGWSVGVVYDSETSYVRTGPQVTLQYYMSDSTFVYAGANYDINEKRGNGGDGFRYSVGIGWAF